jgi:glycosyltransferase involved in cell wall biosynthesis
VPTPRHRRDGSGIRVLIAAHAHVEGTCRRLAELGLEVAGLQPRAVDLGAFGGLQTSTTERQAFPLCLPRVFPLRPYPYSLYLGGVSACLRRFRPDVVLVAGEPSELGVAQVVRLARRTVPGVRIVLHVLENLPLTWHGFPRCLRGWAERATLARVDLIATASQGAAEVLVAKGFDPAHIRRLYLSVDAEAFSRQDRARCREQLGLPQRSFLVGYVGRLVWEKGVDLLLQALAGLPAEAGVVLAGTGDHEPSLRGLARDLGLAERVHFLGRVPRQDLSGVYSALDVLVLPSRGLPRWQEQFGLVLGEAMLCETPLVGSTSGAIPEVLGEAGLTFPEGDSAALAGCLRRLLDDATLRSQLAAAGRQRALTAFAEEAHFPRMAAIIREAPTLPPPRWEAPSSG